MNLSEYILFNISVFMLKRKGFYKGAPSENGIPAVREVLSDGRHEEREYEAFKELSGAYLDKMIDFKDKTVLDFGCGFGYKTKYIAERCKKAIGIDKDKDYIEHAAEKNKLDNLEFKIGLDDSIPIENNSVDIIVCIDAWEHVLKPRIILNEFYRVLRPGGSVFIYFAPWYYPTGAHVEAVIPLPWCHVFFSEKTILNVYNKIYDSGSFVPATWQFDSAGNKKYLYTDNSLTADSLSKISERQFRIMIGDVCKEKKFKCVYYKLEGFKGHKNKFSLLLYPFRYLPILREFIGGFVVCALKKV